MALDKESLFYMSADQLDDVKPLKEVYDLTGKTAVVTGTVGLALHVIHRLAEMGAKVVCAGRGEEWGNLTVSTMREKGYEVSFCKTDVSKVEDCYALVDFAEKTYGTVDIVVPIAATWSARAFVDMKHEELMKCLNVDLVGQYFTVQAAARSMIKGKKGGKIVTISSVAYRGDDQPKMAMMTAYNAAKGGVVGMTKGIAKELKQYGINVNCVAPGGHAHSGRPGQPGRPGCPLRAGMERQCHRERPCDTCVFLAGRGRPDDCGHVHRRVGFYVRSGDRGLRRQRAVLPGKTLELHYGRRDPRAAERRIRGLKTRTF